MDKMSDSYAKAKAVAEGSQILDTKSRATLFAILAAVEAMSSIDTVLRYMAGLPVDVERLEG